MPYFPVFAKRLSPLPALPSPSRIPVPPSFSSKFHGINLLADPHPLTPVSSIFYRNTGGGPASPRRSDVPSHFDLSPFFSNSCALFCTLTKLNSFLFRCFRTLCKKPPGVGYLLSAKSLPSESRRIFSCMPSRTPTLSGLSISPHLLASLHPYPVTSILFP
jgi:hypothetical protein